MPITLQNPVTIMTNEVGNVFEVEDCKFNFRRKEATFFWRIKTPREKVIAQGTETLKDQSPNFESKVEPIKFFTLWYNEKYKSHADLVNKVAELAGYSGEFKQEELI